MKPSARDFKDHLREVLRAHRKTSWGKRELELFIEEVYAEFIERYLED